MALEYSALVNKVLSALKVRDALSQYTPPPMPSGFFTPFITIARDPGSGGHPIGRMVAESLQFQFIDDQLLEEVAKSTKRRKEALQEVDEKGRSAIDDLVNGLFNPDYVSDITFVTEMTKVILSYAYKGNCVILGRGANFITPFAQGLHVRITAPYGVRLARAIDYEGLTPSKAKDVIRSIEKDRNEFVKQYFKKDMEAANGYDLTLNTTYFTPEQSRELIVQAFRAKFSRSKQASLFLKQQLAKIQSKA